MCKKEEIVNDYKNDGKKWLVWEEIKLQYLLFEKKKMKHNIRRNMKWENDICRQRRNNSLITGRNIKLFNKKEIF